MRASIFGVLHVIVLAFVCPIAGAEQSSPEPTGDSLLAKITEMRARIDRELRTDAAKLSLEELSGLKSRLIDQTDKLLEVAEGLEDQFPSHTNVQVVAEHAGFAIGLNAMLDGQCTNILGALSIHFASCMFESELIREKAISWEQATALQSSMESALAAGAIEGIRFNPGSESAFQFLFTIARKARTDAGKKVAQAIADHSATREEYKDFARRTAERRFGYGQNPAISFAATDGRKVDLAQMQGKVVLLNFWGPGCPPCIAEMPHLKELHQKYRDRGFEIIGICVEPDPERTLRTIREQKIPWPNYVDSHGWTNRFSVVFGIYGIPNNWLVDRKGIVREIAVDGEGLEKKIEWLLKGDL